MMAFRPYFELVRKTMTKTNELIVLNCSKTQDVLNCATLLKKGAVVVFPTDTIYGIGCDPYNIESVERIFEIKHRDTKICFLYWGYLCFEDVERMRPIDGIGRTLAKVVLARGLNHCSTYARRKPSDLSNC